MKRSIKLVLLVLLLALFAWPGVAKAQDGDGDGDKFVFGDTYELEEGEELNGNLFVFGGIATIEEGATVNGNITVMGGTLRMDGEVDGDINAMGGLVSLGESAEVDGNVNVAAAQVRQDDGAVIRGEVNTLGGADVPVVPPNLPGPRVRVDPNPLMNAIWNAIWVFLRSFIWMAIAVLVVLFLPKQVERTSQAVTGAPLISGGLGLLTVAILPLLIVGMAITLILIPVSLLTALLLALTWGFGIVVIGTETGKRLMTLFNQQWALPVAAALGTFLLTLVINVISNLIPCIGWLAPAVVGMVGLGAVLLTRFGTQPYPPTGPGMGYMPVTPVIPPAGGVPPASPPAGPYAAEESPWAPEPPADEDR
jgi:cytoskeletal protein CcmA (bactofilin family)